MTMTRILFVAALLSTAGCKKWRTVESGADAPEFHVTTSQPGVAIPEHVERMLRNFERVHFELDSSTLNETSKAALAHNAEIMTQNPDLKIEVQGHCDERGTTEYNMALGDRRAEAVRSYMISEGVAPSRIVTVSYGEENPLAYGDNEDIWSQNRRAEFRITWDEGSVAMGTVQ